MSRAREVSKIVATVDSVENSIDNIDLSSSINTASAAAVAYLIDGAPAALNTLNELAAALNDNESFATTVTNELSSKLSISSASATYLPQTTASATYLPLSGGSVSGNLSVSGYLTNQSVPYFLAHAIYNDTSYNANQILPYPNVIHNQGNNYNSSTSRFTAPVTGNYFFSYTIWHNSGATGRVGIRKNGNYITTGTQSQQIHARLGATATNDSASLSSTLSLNQGDIVDLYIIEGPIVLFYANVFTGFLIG